MDGNGSRFRGRRNSLIVYGKQVGEWVAERAGCPYDSRYSAAIGSQRNGVIHAGVIYTDWNKKSVVCHWAISRGIDRAWLWYIHYYVFRELGAYKVIAPVNSDNVKMLRVAPKMGFVKEGQLVDTQPSGDVVLFTLTADNCRFLGERYGKVRTRSARSA